MKYFGKIFPGENQIDKIRFSENAIKSQKKSQEIALKLFHSAAKHVPAYKKFLKSQEIRPESIKTIEDFKKVPIIDKKNYIDLYPAKELVWGGDLSKNFVINTSSGTTGKPYFWPTSNIEYKEGAEIHETIYKDYFHIDKKQTLLLVCFGMGTWVAGSYTFMSSYLVGKKGYPLTIMTPGFNKKEILRILETLPENFEQTIIAGYPTFVKDVMEEFHKTPMAKKIHIKFLFAGEGFTEDWRSYVLELVNNKNYLNDSINVLGSADMAIMGFETPASIYVRRILSKDVNIAKELFGQERVPSIENYIASHRYFETNKNEILVTANRSIPLIRYNIHDEGGLTSFEEIADVLKNHGIDLFEHLKRNNLNDFSLNLPLIYVFGRGRFTATIYAANIYPENVKDVLTDKEIIKHVTGKFILETKYTSKQEHYLQLNIELVENGKKDYKLAQKIAAIFLHKVAQKNSEYKRIYDEYGSRVKPKVTLFSFGETNLFPANVLKKVS